MDTPPKGPLLARGRTAEIYAWADSAVLKLFFDWVPENWVQHEVAEGTDPEPLPLVIVTHSAETGRFKAALAKINALGAVASPAVFYSMGD